FIAALGLTNITLVLHDWGSGLGFHYWATRESNAKAIAFMEAIIKPMNWNAFPIGPRIGFKLFRAPGIGWLMLSVMNMFVTQILPQMTVRKLSAAEMSQYKAPFPSVDSRRPVRQWPREIPLNGQPADMVKLVSAYSRKLQDSALPKLLIYAKPGAVLNADAVDWCRSNLKNLQTVDVGKGLHYLPEDHPHLIGEALANWYANL
ncbi:MAG: haloalkane dehalogenase, partial [Anaerolineae bacterium]|nr:haloalkane dehalogenase [Anaerolineae bacterium]